MAHSKKHETNSGIVGKLGVHSGTRVTDKKTLLGIEYEPRRSQTLRAENFAAVETNETTTFAPEDAQMNDCFTVRPHTGLA